MNTNSFEEKIPKTFKKHDTVIKIRSFFYPFKRRKLNRVGVCVLECLKKVNIQYPISIEFNNSSAFSKYAVGQIDSWSFINYKIRIYYNPRYISLDLKELVKTGIHEYCHIIYRQKELFSDPSLEHFLKIDYHPFKITIDCLTQKYFTEVINKIPTQDRMDFEKTKNIREEIFVEVLAEYILGTQNESIIADSQHFQTIISTHIQIMNKIRFPKFREPEKLDLKI
ncbi:MAG: hypothetical protein ABFC24_00790 [Methanoregulaceae archaeon]